MADYKSAVQRMLSLAEIEINGNRPWDVQIHHPGFYKRVITEGELGLGESYMDGWWTCEALDQLFYKILSTDIRKQIKVPFTEAASLLLTSVTAYAPICQPIGKPPPLTSMAIHWRKLE